MKMRAFDLALSTLFATLTAIGALISIPIYPVPITLQTFFIYIAGALLGGKRAALSQLIYLGMRVSGLSAPLGGIHGPQAMIGPTGGYLIGFIFGAFVMGKVLEKGIDHRKALIGFTIGTLIIYLFGIIHLAIFIKLTLNMTIYDSIIAAIVKGLLPFILGDSLKVLLATYLVTRNRVLELRKRLILLERSAHS
ncbi:MAG: biotin transporter BioY [Nitrososphaerales archaeon]|nr:biotin transporter BioY [Nitrososphaerales archaeon]